jgi:hypothetical protein
VHEKPKAKPQKLCVRAIGKGLELHQSQLLGTGRLGRFLSKDRQGKKL